MTDHIDVDVAPTDTLATDLFMDRFGDDTCYVRERKAWFVWDGRRWIIDLGGDRMTALMQRLVRGIYAKAAAERDASRRQILANLARHSAAARTHRAMLQLATGRQEHVRNLNDFDVNPFLFNVANGVVDLRTGELREHQRGDLITRISNVQYDPDARCPRFDQFVNEVFLGDRDLITYIQRFAGYSLTGDTREQIFTLLYGVGSNGKSTFLNALHGVLGEYGQATPADTFLPRKSGTATNDLARLAGVRFVSAIEVESGRRLAEALVKAMTGGDRVPARFLYGEFFEYVPVYKPVLAVNHLPKIRGGDFGIWRRVRAVPFKARFEGKAVDKELAEKLQVERCGILAWCVRGCLEWQRYGLDEVDAVRIATKAYRAETDIFDAFLRERCERDGDAKVSATELRAAYVDWAHPNGEEPVSANALGRLLSTLEFAPTHTKSGTIWNGLRLREDRDVSPDMNGRASSAAHV